MGHLDGSIAIASHNIRFDRQFLQAEFVRIGHQFPDCHCLCTMELAGGGSLARCCDDYGICIDGSAHYALADARAAALLLSCILQDSPRLRAELLAMQTIQWPPLSKSTCMPVTRADSMRRRKAPPSYLQQLALRLEQFADSEAEDGAALEYLALLGRVLEDRHVEDTEGDALTETAIRWGLSMQCVRELHEKYLERLVSAAWVDGVVTDAERRDLALVTRLLGIDEKALDAAIKDGNQSRAETSGSAAAQDANGSMIGKRVCFTGELQCKHQGTLLSREEAEALARTAGMEVVDSVTKKLDVLVVADPLTQSGKAKKARKYGIRILHEPVFWSAINVDAPLSPHPT